MSTPSATDPTSSDTMHILPSEDGSGHEVIVHAIDSPFRHFPTEIVQLILSSAPDAVTLRSLILSTSSFYKAFIAADRLILQAVEENEFSTGILPEALFALVTADPAIPHDGHLYESYFQHRNDFLSLASPRSFSDSLAMSSVYVNVKYFARQYASTLCGNPVTEESNQKPIELSRSEMTRIERALYWFELTCNLTQSEDDDPERLTSRLAAWESEQLVTVYEYLLRRLSIPFADVAEHDIEWGEMSVPWQCDEGPLENKQKEYLLSRGLSFLRRLDMTTKYGERRKILTPLLFSPEVTFLDSVLDPMNGMIEVIELDQLTEEERAEYIKVPFTEDPDAGPFEFWSWAHRGLTNCELYHAREHYQFRKLGYVMFDYKRLREWEFSQEPYISPEIQREDKEWDCRQDEMTKSWKVRSDIWVVGGRGWWSEGDESQIRWFREETDRRNDAWWNQAANDAYHEQLDARFEARALLERQ